mmetsp:Transcript_8557/g.23806  ORF Transcript_8557/g.23806 Transcript_8557/m.23806 type:complete len:266 (-) Transcript_8557:637-1434(-)
MQLLPRPCPSCGLRWQRRMRRWRMFGGNWRRVSGGSVRRSRSFKAYRYLQCRLLEVLAHSLLRHPTRETRVWTVVHLLLLLRMEGQFQGHLAAATVPLSAGRQFLHSTRQPEESTMLTVVSLSAGRQFLGQSGRLGDRRTKARDLFPARHMRHPASRLCRLWEEQKMPSIVQVAKAVYENLHENQEKPLVNPLASALVNRMEKKDGITITIPKTQMARNGSIGRKIRLFQIHSEMCQRRVDLHQTSGPPSMRSLTTGGPSLRRTS